MLFAVRFFTAAAQRTHTTQPNISAQIRALERELGAALFDRAGRRVRLTDAGAAALPAARASLRSADAMAQSVADVNDLLTNTLGAALGVLATNIIPRLSDSPEKLETQAGKPREVTRGRRLLALLIDVWWVILINLIGLGLITAVSLVIMAGDPSRKPAVEHAIDAYGSIIPVALSVCYVIVAMTGRLGVSLPSGPRRRRGGGARP